MSKESDKLEKIDPQVAREAPKRQIPPSVTGEAWNIFVWLEDQFYIGPVEGFEAPDETGERKPKPKRAPDKMPERVVLRSLTRKGGTEISSDIMYEQWKPMVSPCPPKEVLVMLANKFYSAAINDASSNSRPQRYCLFAYSNLQGPAPYARYAFSVDPSVREVKEGNEGLAVDDDDTQEDRRRRDEQAHDRFMRAFWAKSFDGLMHMYASHSKQLADHNASLYNALRQHEADRRALIDMVEEGKDKAFERLEAAKDRAAERDKWIYLIREISTVIPEVQKMITGYAMLKNAKSLPRAEEGKQLASPPSESGGDEPPPPAPNPVRTMIEGLTVEQKQALFNPSNGEILGGIFTKEECDMLFDIADSDPGDLTLPLKVRKFIGTISSDMARMVKVNEIIGQENLAPIIEWATSIQ